MQMSITHDLSKNATWFQLLWVSYKAHNPVPKHNQLKVGFLNSTKALIEQKFCQNKSRIRYRDGKNSGWSLQVYS